MQPVKTWFDKYPTSEGELVYFEEYGKDISRGFYLDVRDAPQSPEKLAADIGANSCELKETSLGERSFTFVCHYSPERYPLAKDVLELIYDTKDILKKHAGYDVSASLEIGNPVIMRITLTRD